jgi:SRSO17 transposase
MDLQAIEALNADLAEFTGDIFTYRAYQGQRSHGRQYLRGLMLDAKRKSVEPMAGRLGLPRQNLGHFVAQSTWEYTEVMRRVAARAIAVVEPAAWLIDDHPFLRYGHGTAGAIVQHCGERGQHLCQVAVSIHAVSKVGSTPLHWRLFIPQAWTDDPVRRAKSGIPSWLSHRTKQQIALDLLDEAAEWGLAPPLVVADSDYGTNACVPQRPDRTRHPLAGGGQHRYDGPARDGSAGHRLGEEAPGHRGRRAGPRQPVPGPPVRPPPEDD